MTECPKRTVLGQGPRGSKGSARSAQRGRRETPCRLTPGAAGACLGRRKETQITEVASHKGHLQNGGCFKIQSWLVYFSCQAVIGRNILCFNFVLSVGITAGWVHQEARLSSHFGKIWTGRLILSGGRKEKKNTCMPSSTARKIPLWK